MEIDVSLILPAYNEAERIEGAVRKVREVLEGIGYSWEIIIAEDGSTDGTDEIAFRIADGERIRVLHSEKRLGRGNAIMRGAREARGRVVAFMDVDMATDLRHLKELIDSVLVEGYDVAIGSRLAEGSNASRPLSREIASRLYNFLVRFLLGSRIRDHQCGFKAFKREVLIEVGEEVRDGHWFWDTEFLVLAQRKGLRIKEIPVEWKHGGKTKVKLIGDSIYMFKQILRMKFG